MDKIGYLRESILFSGMPPADLSQVSGSFHMANFPKGKVIHRPDDPGDVLFILKQGRVRIFRLAPDGRELTLTELTAGTVFGEMSLFGQTMYGSYAEAIEDSVICVVNRETISRMLEKNPTIALRLAEILGRRLLEAENRLESVGLRDVPRRLANLLLELANRSDDQLKIDRRYTHEELAKMIGTSRESVTLALNDFRRRGWVSVADHHIAILEVGSLGEFAGK